MSELYEEHRKQSQQRRGNNREQSAQLLTDMGVFFERKNMGAHLIVRHDDKVVDFWPGTGKWKVRGSTYAKRGVFNLLKLFGIKAL